jgi:hypothetical protein
VQGVGIVLDDRTMLTADARRTSVVVADLPADPLGFARPALPHVPARQVSAAADGGLPWRCGGVSVPAGVGGRVPERVHPEDLVVPHRHRRPRAAL